MSHLDQAGADVRKQLRCKPVKLASAAVHSCAAGDKPRPNNTRRICTQPSCGTILSIYNPGKYCSVCIQRMVGRNE